MYAMIATWRMALDGVSRGKEMLAEGCCAADALESAIRMVEEREEYTSVGYGGLPNAQMQVELDAGFMAGIDNVVGAIIFAILILAVTQILVECGIMRRILDFAQSTLVATVRQAELFIVGVTILASIPISANAPAELLVGPSIVRPLGERFGLAAARRANLMDCAVCTIFFVLPWHIAVAAWYGALYSAAETYAIPAPPISAALYNPYSWALLAVLLFSAFTGWNRKYAKDEAPAA